MLDKIIKNGVVIDGTGAKARNIDVGINGDTITLKTKAVKLQARECIDAKGLIVCPGFIDIHSHADFTLFVEPPGRSKIMQGVTTEVCGNCGLSASPLFGAVKEKRSNALSALGLKITWSTLKEYINIARKKSLLNNIAPLIGHGNIRGAVMGYDCRSASASEIKKMVYLLQSEMESGAWGFSSGLIYPPGIYASQEELSALAKIAAQYDGIYSSHIRSEGAGVVEAVDEAIKVASDAGVSVQISHLKTMGRKNWNKLHEVFKKIEEARQNGLNISADRYPYTAASTDLDWIFPPWALEGGIDKDLKRMRDPQLREKIFSYIAEQGLFEDLSREVFIARVFTVKNKALEGKSLAEAAHIRKQSVKDLFFDILIEENFLVDAIFFSMSEKNLKKILRKDYVMIGSDSAVWDMSGPLGEGWPHPRCFGAFPRVVRKYVFKEKILSLEVAIRKMTGQPAEKLGLHDRGLIQEGFKADLVIFDKELLHENTSYENPHQFPAGFYGVMINGQWVVKDGTLTGNFPGRVLLKVD